MQQIRIKIILSIILIVMMTFLAGCTKPNQPEETITDILQEEVNTVPTEAIVEPTKEPLPEELPEDTDDLMVSTPYCNLYFPGEYKKNVSVDEQSTANGYIVSFSAMIREEETELFSVYIAEAGENSIPVGIIIYEGIPMDVSMEMHEIVVGNDWDESDIEDISAKQEGINYLLEKLKESPVFTPVSMSAVSDKTQTNTSAPQDMVVTTPYCDLYYPAQWKDAVRCESEETGVGYISTFYGKVNGKEAVLFTVYFAEASDDSFPIGVFSENGIMMDVSISVPELQDDSWSDYEKDLYYALQEKINYLIEKLDENWKFKPLTE